MHGLQPGLKKDALLKELKSFLESAGGRKTFLEHEVKALLRNLGLPVPGGVFIGKKEKGRTPQTLSFPVVAKVSSAGISSKSDVHGVRTGIRDAQELGKAVDELMAIEGAEGVIIEEMAPQGVEVIVGGIIDRQFGPVVMFGLGGIFVELFKDVAFGLAPASEAGASALIRQVKGYRLLESYRGRPREDIDTLVRIIVAVSWIMSSGLIEEIDLNPVALYPQGAIILDAKMTATSP